MRASIPVPVVRLPNDREDRAAGNGKVSSPALRAALTSKVTGALFFNCKVSVPLIETQGLKVVDPSHR
jgi:hypothetical protein